MTFLRTLTLQGKLLASAAVLLFVVAIAAGLYFSGKRDGKASERAATAEAGQKAVTSAREADVAAHDTVKTGNDAVEAENAAAREAAAGSDDPLKAAMESIRGARP